MSTRKLSNAFDSRRQTTVKLTKVAFRLPLMLIVLSTVPILGGIARLGSLSPNATVSAENARFVASPFPIVVHVVTATVYCLLGAFQFSSGLRLRWPRWHRRAGKVLAVCGLSAGFTGIWMTTLYPIPHDMQGPILYAARIGVGVTMVASILLGWRSILRRDVARHEAWMIRAYALGQGAGTQAVLLLPWILILGNVLGLARDLALSAAWGINWAVAEWIIRRRPKPAVIGTSAVNYQSSLAESR